MAGKTKKITIGILALQGCVSPHLPHLKALGVDSVEVRCTEDLDGIDGLILPGGESSTMLKLLKTFDMEKALAAYLQSKPAWGICAGAILMAKTVSNPEQFSFGALDMDVKRNAYGRQLESRQQVIDTYPVSYIRAPQITRTGPKVTVLAKDKADPVWVQSGKTFASTFHPELTLQFPSPMHLAFVAAIKPS